MTTPTTQREAPASDRQNMTHADMLALCAANPEIAPGVQMTKTWQERIAHHPDHTAAEHVDEAKDAEIADLRALLHVQAAHAALNDRLAKFRQALAPYHYDNDDAAIAKIAELVRMDLAARGGKQ